MIRITWHLILYILIEIIGFVWAISSSDDDGSYGISTRDCRIIFWLIASIIGILIYGGIFWW